MDILDLPHFRILSNKETEFDRQIELETVETPSACPHCGCVSNLYRYGKREQLFMDLPFHGKRVGLLVHRQRYQCRDCQQTFLERLDHTVDEKRNATKRLVEYIEKQSLKRTFVSIAEDVGLDEKTIRNIFRDYVNQMEKEVQFEIPKWLGIDEIHIIKPRCVITNIEDRTIVDLLPNRNKETVIRYLQQLRDRERIQYVTMDMWRPYKEAVQAVIPHAVIIVDKFHVVRMANDVLESVRKEIRADLLPKQRRGLLHDRFILFKRERELTFQEQLIFETWTKNYETLGKAYRLKEAFYAIWDSHDRESALKLYREWRESIPDTLLSVFDPLLKAMEHWETEIFAYFDHPITNAYTEALNGLIRAMYRLGRGYSFEALRAKMLFTESVTKTKKPAYPKRKFPDREVLYDSMMRVNAGMIFEHDEKPISLGVDISTLTQLLESGEF